MKNLSRLLILMVLAMALGTSFSNKQLPSSYTLKGCDLLLTTEPQKITVQLYKTDQQTKALVRLGTITNPIIKGNTLTLPSFTQNPGPTVTMSINLMFPKTDNDAGTPICMTKAFTGKPMPSVYDSAIEMEQAYIVS